MEGQIVARAHRAATPPLQVAAVTEYHWLAVLIVVVMGVTAMAATGRFRGLDETFDDRPDSRVPAGRPLTAEEASEPEGRGSISP